MNILSEPHRLSKVNQLLMFHRRKVPAFILNLDQHWFTLRRFGDASPLIEADEGNGLWFNLNSSLPAPEWLSKTYLGMVISQAEAEGKCMNNFGSLILNANHRILRFCSHTSRPIQASRLISYTS